MLANRLNVEVFVAAGTGFGVAKRDRDAELFGAPAAVLGDALGIELAVAVRTFFNLIVRMQMSGSWTKNILFFGLEYILFLGLQ